MKTSLIAIYILLQLLYSVLAKTNEDQPKIREYYESYNWTSCEEFLNNSVFNPEAVLNVNWKIFFFWNPEIEESYNIQFSRPSKILVDRFRVELDDEIKPPVNWTDAELFMETTIDFSALFIKTKYSGIYRIIPSTAFDLNSVPLLVFALKVVEPGYLGIVNCKHRICYALAPADKMPYHYELEQAASNLKFYNNFNRSHVSIRKPATEGPLAPKDEPDDDLDDELEVDHSDKVQLL